MDARLERTTDQNEVLKAENEALKTELAQDRKGRARLLAVLEGLDHKHPKKRGRRVLGTTAVAGTAYVLGTRAGRERYEQLGAWWGRLRGSRPAGALAETSDRMSQAVTRGSDERGRDVRGRPERGA